MSNEQKRRGAAKNEGGNGTLIALVVGGLLLLVCCAGVPVGFGAWWFLSDRAPKQAAGDKKPADDNKGGGVPKVSRASYDKIPENATIAQAQAILGPGQELNTKPGDRFRDFVWRANEGGRQIEINLSFDNGKLVGRSIEH